MGQYENSLGIDRPVIARVVTDGQRAVQLGQEPGGVILQRQGHTLAQSIAAEGVLFQSGVPFWLPPGDGGSNGLNFTGTRGVFTLSAAVLTNFHVLLTYGGYAYLPAGSGGLAEGGLFFCKMTDDTNGEIFQEKYSGVGTPLIPASPTAHPNLTAGRITQTTLEVTVVTVTVPGNSMGPNGFWKALWGARMNNSATNKQVRVRFNTTTIGTSAATTANHVVDAECIRQNAGVVSVQNGNSPNVGRLHTTSTAMVVADRGIVDTSVDNTISLTLTLGANTDSCLGILRNVSVGYGA